MLMILLAIREKKKGLSSIIQADKSIITNQKNK